MPAAQLHPIGIPKLAACLITKDSAETIELALASARMHVDAIYIYDTGSTDETFEIIERLNEETEIKVADAQGVEHVVALAPIIIEKGEWRNDFAWAREQSWKMVPEEYDWLLWFDDDDTLDVKVSIRDLCYRSDPDVDAFVVRYDYAHDELGNCICVLWRERLIRRSRGYKWMGAVHEVLVPPEGHRPNMVVLDPGTQLRYIHRRPADRYTPTRNLDILLAEEKTYRDKDEPVPLRTLAYLGTEYMSQMQPEKSVAFFREYLESDQPHWSDERMQVTHKLATCMRMFGDASAALHLELEALKERFDWTETHVGITESYAMMGNWPAAAFYAKQALQLGQPQSMLILNPLEFTLVPMLRLCESCMAAENWNEARSWLDQANAVAPGNPYTQQKGAELDNATKYGQTVQAVLDLREILVRHDENEKAYRLMEAAPYFVAEDPRIVKARSDQRENVRHLLKPEEYRRWYADEPKESTFPWEDIDDVGRLFERTAGLLKGLKEQEQELGRKPRCLDLGCNDWAIVGAYLWRNGFDCDGIELNKNSFERANELVWQEGAHASVNPHLNALDERGVAIYQGDLHDAPKLIPEMVGKYDAVSIFEVIEHVPDVEQALDVCEQMLRPGGRVYISTPNGAFERGNLPLWNRVERKGHLRALPVEQLSEMLIKRGQIVDLNLHVDPNDPRLTFISYVPKKRKQKIIFYAGGSWEEWSPLSINEGGLGGSETALVQVATRLSMAGHVVKVYCGATPGVYGGVLWRPQTAWDPTEECDLLVVSRQPHVFDDSVPGPVNTNFGAKRTALWCHDHSYPQILTERAASRIDSIIVLSEWQQRRFAELYPFAKDKLTVIRNGIGLLDPETGVDRYADAREIGFEQRKPRCIYSSSADRGLDVLLSIWPRIREQVPEAELHIFYGWDVFDRVALVNPGLRDYKRNCFQLLEDAGGEDGGIFMRGRIGQKQLQQEMAEARVWSYPTAFLETSCIGAMEARAAGLPIVTSNLGALQETVSSNGLLINWSTENEDERVNESKPYQRQFVKHVTRLLSDADFWSKWQSRGSRGVIKLDWSKRVPEWEALLPALPAAKKPVRKRRAKPLAPTQ